MHPSPQGEICLAARKRADHVREVSPSRVAATHLERPRLHLWALALALPPIPCHHIRMQTVFEAAGGMEGMRRLAHAWHQRVIADEVVAHAFSHGFHPDHTERLAAYWAEALGGPASYSDSYGDETAVVRMHSGNGVA